MSSSLAQEIASHLQTKGLPPTQEWLSTFLSSTKPNPGLKQTALFRLQNSDITTSLQRSPTTTFPRDILNAQIKDRRIQGPIAVQVLDIEDIGRSRWSQAEALEAEERGETTKGREIIRVVPGDVNAGSDDADQNGDVKGGGPFKLLLQDAAGVCVYGFELFRVEGVGIGVLSVGAKMLLRDFTMARGVVLLEPRSCQVLGGKIEALHKRWKEGRKDALKGMARQAGGVQNPNS